MRSKAGSRIISTLIIGTTFGLAPKPLNTLVSNVITAVEGRLLLWSEGNKIIWGGRSGG